VIAHLVQIDYSNKHEGHKNKHSCVELLYVFFSSVVVYVVVEIMKCVCVQYLLCSWIHVQPRLIASLNYSMVDDHMTLWLLKLAIEAMKDLFHISTFRLLTSDNNDNIIHL